MPNIRMVNLNEFNIINAIRIDGFCMRTINEEKN